MGSNYMDHFAGMKYKCQHSGMILFPEGTPGSVFI